MKLLITFLIIYHIGMPWWTYLIATGLQLTLIIIESGDVK